MKRLISFVATLSVLVSIATYGNDIETKELETIANEVRVAVLKKDIETLLKYVPPLGTEFLDKPYTYGDIKELMKTKNSWLYKHLFVGEKSVKKYFENAKNLKTKLFHRNHDAVLVSYQSTNFDPIHWIECCLIRIDGKWFFDGIFYCG